MNTMIKIENPVNKINLLFWASIGMFGFIGGNVLIIVESGFQWFGVLVGISIATIIFIIVWLQEYYRRPISVEVTDSGVVLYLRYWRKPEIVNWGAFTMLNVDLVDPRPSKNWHTLDGFLKVKNKWHALFWPLAMAVREAYREKMGHYPPNPSDERNR